MVTHTGTETLPRLLREAAVENLPQWAHCPDSCGRLQSRIFRNGRKPDGAMPREGRRPSGREPLSPGTKHDGTGRGSHG